MRLVCTQDENIVVECREDVLPPGDKYRFEIFPADMFVALALYSIKRGQTEKLLIHGYEVWPLLTDQTEGDVDLHDIFRTNHKERPFQRLSDILNNDFQP